MECKKKVCILFSTAQTVRMSAPSLFAARLRRVVDRAGGVNAVARAVDVSPGAVYGWLAGAQPYRRTILKLCAKLGVSEEWMLDGNGSEEPGHVSNQHGWRGEADTAHVGERTDESPAQELSQMLAEFDHVPPHYVTVALERIRQKFEDFMISAATRPPREPVKYTPAKPAKKIPKP